MKITKKHLDTLKRCYSTSHVHVNQELNILLASEASLAEPQACYAYSGKNFQKREVVWQFGGGCMAMVALPHKENEFIAIKDFYLSVTPSLSRLVWLRHDNMEGWIEKTLLYLPFLHRFEIVTVGEKNYIVAATIADHKDHKEDWSVGGSIYLGELPLDLNQELKLEKIKDNLFRNHGFIKQVQNGKEYVYFGSDEGIFKLSPSENFKFEQILSKPIGEMAFADLNQDGIDELITIEPFHGDQIHIYELKDGKYEMVYTYPDKINFAHALVPTTLRGIPTFVVGIRRENADLAYIQYVNGKYERFVIDAMVGPANICVINEEKRDLIVSANHSANEAAVYIVEED